MRNPRLRLLLACTASLLAASPLLLAQLPTWPTAATLSICRAGLTGRVVVVQDGLSTSDCSTGGAIGAARHSVMCLCDQDGAGGYIWRAIGSGGGGGGSIDSITASPPITTTGGTDPVLGCAAGSTSARGCLELATSAETTAGLAVQASDTRLSDSRAPSGSASGDLTGTYPGPTVAANSVALGTDTTGGYAASVSEAGPATTATALAANGANCSAGQAPLGVDASGAVEGCFTPAGGSPDGSGTELQFRGGSSTFSAVTGSSVSSGAVTLGSTLTVPTVSGGGSLSGNLILSTNSSGTKGVLCLEDCTSSSAGWKATTLAGAPAIRYVRADFGAGAASIANMFAVPNETAPTATMEPAMLAMSTDGEIRWRDGSTATVGSVDAQISHVNGGMIVIHTLLKLTPTSGVTCDAGAKGVLYVASGDGTLCSCNGTTWTPTPLSGTCD